MATYTVESGQWGVVKVTCRAAVTYSVADLTGA